MAMMTEIKEQREVNYLRREMMEEINPHMGHQAHRVANIVDDEAALQHATGPN